jgi:hypothetical protein
MAEQYRSSGNFMAGKPKRKASSSIKPKKPVLTTTGASGAWGDPSFWDHLKQSAKDIWDGNVGVYGPSKRK